jgi:murein DD-endopeptidase MepM/ murein hydrolase activator NlpD
MYTNGINDPNSLRVGQSLKILPLSGITYKVKAGDTLESVAKKFNIASSGYSAQILLDVNLLDTNELKEGQDLLVPGASLDSFKPTPTPKPKPTQPIIAGNQPVNTSPSFIPSNVPAGISFLSPTSNPSLNNFKGIGNITTCFSSYHPALDIDHPSGLIDLVASSKGKVTWAGWNLTGGSGIAVQIDHQNGYVTEYYHLSQLSVSLGQSVVQGQKIGLMGTTGRSTGPHVHFIIKYNGVSVDPRKLIDFSSYPREGGISC